MIQMIKDPEEDLDFTWDFDEVLEDDESIADYEMVVATPLVLHDVASAARAVTAYVSPGGVSGTSYLVTCRVTSTATPPRIYDRTIRFKLLSL